FAARPDLGVLLVLTVRPTLDLWAGGAAGPGAHRFNIASALALMVIVLGGSYLLEQHSDVVRAPALRGFLVFAGIAAPSIPLAPSVLPALTEWLRLFSILVLYAFVFTVTRTRRQLVRTAVAIAVSAVPPVLLGLVQTAHGGSRVIADFGRATGTFLHPVP